MLLISLIKLSPEKIAYPGETCTPNPAISTGSPTSAQSNTKFKEKNYN